MATQQERAELHKTIWKIANELRGSVDGWEFKACVLGSIFYRFISENICDPERGEDRPEKNEILHNIPRKMALDMRMISPNYENHPDEYMAILSGNTDLLDKAKLEKKIAALEGERKSFNKGRNESVWRLEVKQEELERIPQTIEQYKEKNAVLEKDIPQLKEIAGKQWKKEDDLKGLKSELAALDRKIQLELAARETSGNW